MDKTGTIVGAFGADHVERLTGLSKGQLAYWDRTGFFAPEYAPPGKREPYGRVYSFRDVVGLRALALLRREHGISLQRLRAFARKLDGYDTGAWSHLRLYVLNRDVYVDDGTGGIARNADGQTAPVVFMKDVIGDVAERVAVLKRRASDEFGRIEQHRGTMRNASVVAGTRIPTAAIRRYHAAGYTEAQILDEYPTLTRRDIAAALQHEDRQEHLARSA